MSEGGTPTVEAGEAEVVERRGPSIVWLIPAVALVIGAIIWWQTSANQGPVITILLKDGGGIEAAKTKVRYRGLEAGEVIEVGIRDIDTVQVKAQLGPGAWPYMTTQAKFWVEKPRVGAGGISGLDTLVSGSYITMELPPLNDEGIPEGESTLEFIALEKPPLTAKYPNGLRIGLQTDDLRGLGTGSDIRFRDILVGEVDRYELNADGQGVRIWALISEEYRDLVRPSTEFWNSTGVELDVRPAGVTLQVESLASMLGGAIDFSTPPEAYIERPVGDGAIFDLHKDRVSAAAALEQGVGLRIWLEAHSVGSLSEGSAIYYRDVEIGSVGKPELAEDARSVRFPIQIGERYRTLVRKNSRFWNHSGFRFEAGWKGIEAQIGSVGSLLAGGVVVATPNSPGEGVEDHAVFMLHEKPETSWLAWNPSILIREVDEEEKLPRVLRSRGSGHSGVRVVLVAPTQGSLSEGAPIHYRGHVVGEIGDTRFSADSRLVEADAWIEYRYAKLVRTNTRFWNSSGIDVDAGIRSGVKIR
ncbi:MAG: MCE family protein, partial [Deltaproteobacteria bacterium]|nr:MCE family protein [Deltaproteobacteria bacterium]